MNDKSDEIIEKSGGGTGFDGVVRKDRKERKLAFGPQSRKIIKPNAILIDIYGVITPWTFIRQLKAYAKNNLIDYVRNHWESRAVQSAIDRLREIQQANPDLSIPIIAAKSDEKEEDWKQSVTKALQFVLDKQLKQFQPELDRLSAKVWANGFDSGGLKSEIYQDVLDAFNYWRFEEFIKIYSYASGTVEGQRQFLKSTIVGDLNRFVANGLNSSGGYKYDSNKFTSLCAALREPQSSNILYLTDDPKKARAAEKAGLRTIVINRNEPGAKDSTSKYNPTETAGLVIVTTLSDIEFVSELTTANESIQNRKSNLQNIETKERMKSNMKSKEEEKKKNQEEIVAIKELLFKTKERGERKVLIEEKSKELRSAKIQMQQKSDSKSSK